MSTGLASDKLRDFIKRQEGHVKNFGQYKDVTGKLTSGYGSTNTGFVPKNKEEAEQQLEIEIGYAESRARQAIDEEVLDRLSQNQKDVVVDMAYNLRNRSFNQWARLLNEGKLDEAGTSLSQYTKARSEDTGQLTVYPGLVKRAQERQNMWFAESVETADQRGLADQIKDLFSQPEPPTPQPTTEGQLDPGARQFDDATILSAIDAAGGEDTRTPHQQDNSDSPAPEAFSDAQIAAAIDEEEIGPYMDAIPRDMQRLEDARSQADPAEFEKRLKGQELAKRYGISKEDGVALVDHPQFSDLKAKESHYVLADQFPHLSKWAAQPDNYVLLNNDLEGLKSLEREASAMADFSNVLWYSQLNVGEFITHGMIASGVLTEEEGIAHLKKIREEMRKHPVVKYQEGVQAIQNSFLSVSKSISETGDIIRAARAVSPEDSDKIIPMIMDANVRAAKGVAEMFVAAKTIVKNPAAFALISLQSSMSAVIPITSGAAGGLVGAASPIPFGAALGSFAGASAGSFVVSFGQYIHQKMADQNLLDQPEVFYANAKNVEDIKQAAIRYGITHAAFDGLMQVFAGTSLGKAFGTNVSKITGATVKEVGGQAVGEGVGEIAAQLAAGEKIEKALGEGLQESVFSLPAIGLRTGAGLIVDTAKKAVDKDEPPPAGTEAGAEPAPEADAGPGAQEKPTPHRKKLALIENVVSKSTQAVGKFKAYQRLREKWQESSAAKQSPDQVADLVNTAANEETTLDRADMTFEVESQSPKRIKTLEDQADATNTEANLQEMKDTKFDQEVRIAASDFDRYFSQQNLNAADFITLFDDGVVDSYARAKRDSGEFRIPLTDFLREFADDEDIASIVRFGDNDFNASEAQAALDLIDQKMPELFQTTGDDEDGPQFNFMEGEPAMEEPVLRPIELISRFRTEKERQVSMRIKRKLKNSTKNIPDVTDEMLDAVAEIQFRHTRFRAEVTGKSIDDVEKGLTMMEDANIIKKRARGLVKYNNFGQLLIKFQGKRADPVTIIHELAHTWLYDMMFDWNHIHSIAEDQLTQSQREYKEVMTSAANLLNVESLRTMLDVADANEGRDFTKLHETFAQTAEKYFLEGTFVSNGVRRIFELMRRWMRPFAEIIGKTYPHFPPLVIRPEVERIFEVILDATNAAEEQVYNMFPEGLFDPTQLGPQGAKYADTVRKARDEAVAEAYTKVFNTNIKEREKLINRALDEIFDEATEEVNRLPGIRLAEAFKNVPVEARVSRKDFDELFGEDAIKTIPKGIVTGKKKTGRPLSEILGEIGIEDPNVFLEMLQQAAQKDELVQKLADDIVELRFPKLKTDEEIHRIAVDALNSAGKERLLRAEMKILAEKHLSALKQLSKRAILPARFASKMAKENTQALGTRLALEAEVKGYKSENFLRQSDRHGRDAANSWAKSDIEAALGSKQQQLIYFEAYKNAKKIERAISRSSLRIKRIIKNVDPKKVARSYDIEGYRHMQQMIAAFMNFDRIPLVNVDAFGGSRQVYSPEWQNAVNARLSQLDGLVQSRRDFTPDAQTYLFFADTVAMLRSAAYNARVTDLKGRSMLRSRVASVVSSEIGPRRPSDPTETPGRRPLFRKYLVSLERFRESMSPFFKNDLDFEKSVIGTLWNMVAEAEADFTADKEATLNKIGEAARNMAKASRDTKFKEVFKPLASRTPYVSRLLSENRAIHSDELGVTFNSLEEVITMLLYLGSESGTEKFLRGGFEKGKPLAGYDLEAGRIDDGKAWDFVNRLINEGVLVKEHFEFAQSIWDAFEEHYAAANKAHERIYGFKFGKIQPKGFSTPFGNFRGGYFPVTADQSYAELTPNLDAMVIDGGQGAFDTFFPASNIGFTKQRKNFFYPVSRSLNSVPTALHNVLQLKHLKVPMYEFGKIMGDEVVTNALNQRRPGIVRDVVRPFFSRVMAQQYTSASREDVAGLAALNTVSRIIRRNARRLWFLANFKSAAKQFLGVIQAAGRVSPRRLAEASMKYTLNPIESSNQIIETSKRMRVRFEGNQRRMINDFDRLDLNGDWISWTDEKVDHATFFLIQHAQNIVDSVVWMAAYEKGIASGLSEGQAISLGDNTVEKTQASSAISNRSAIQQTQEVVRLLTDFSAVPITQFQQMLETYRRSMDEETYIRFRRQAGMALAVMTVPIILMEGFKELYDSAVTPDDVEEDEERRGKENHYVLRMLTEHMDTLLPVLGRHAGSLVSGQNIRISPALSAYDALSKAYRGASDYADEVDVLPSDAAAMFDAVTLLTGIPFSPIGRGLRTVHETDGLREIKARNIIRRRQKQRVRLQSLRERRRSR